MLGHDGPGWILRGFVTGVGAEPDNTEEWPYDTFQGTVVRMPAEPRGTAPSSGCAGRSPVSEPAA